MILILRILIMIWVVGTLAYRKYRVTKDKWNIIIGVLAIVMMTTLFIMDE